CWKDDPMVIKSTAFEYFSRRYKGTNHYRPRFHSDLFLKLDIIEAGNLEAEFTMDELKEAVWSCSSIKSPGPDGFNFKFLKRYWDVLKFDFFNYIKHFENTWSLANGCNASFIVMVPKKDVPCEIGDYLIVNGSPTNEFKMERGVRQGDSLSSFIFLIVSEALQVMVIDACNKGIFSGVSLADNGANISLLQYADDVLFFGEWSKYNATNLTHLIECYHEVSGLKVNFSKSCLYGVGVPYSDVVSLARYIKCSHGSLPFMYLGLPVGKNIMKSTNWNGVIDRFSKKLLTWKANMLSIGERIT
nr:transposon TX1 uncharacterized [Tanacetum cinerariifolium]